MNFTSKGQPYKSWKTGSSHTSIIANNSRPLRDSDNYPHIFRTRPNPLKHWRNQLIPLSGSGYGKSTVNSVIERPGGTHIVQNECCEKNNNASSAVSTYIPNVNSTSSQNCEKNICNRSRITRSASTIIKKDRKVLNEY